MTIFVEHVEMLSRNDHKTQPKANPDPNHEKIILKNITLLLKLPCGLSAQERCRS